LGSSAKRTRLKTRILPLMLCRKMRRRSTSSLRRVRFCSRTEFRSASVWGGPCASNATRTTHIPVKKIGVLNAKLCFEKKPSQSVNRCAENFTRKLLTHKHDLEGQMCGCVTFRVVCVD
jgi:hypothetical protein